MVAVQKDYWYFMVLMMSLYFIKGSVQMKAPESTITLKEEMVLDCLCPWSGQLTMVSWTKKPLLKPIAIYHPQFGTNFAPSYDGRVVFLKSTPMDGSIAITNVSQTDIGHYHCSLQTYPQGSWTKDTVVKNRAITTTISIQPDNELVVAENDNLTIKCNHIHDGEVYQVSIEKLGAEADGSNIIATCQMLDDGELELSKFNSRGRLNCSDAMEVSLQLTNIVKDDGGLYRCNFSTDIGVQSTTILLTTLSLQELTRLQYMLYVYIGAGVIGGVLLMGLILLVTWVNRRKRKREEYRIKLHPGKRQQRNHYEHGCVYDRMKKGTRMGARDKEIYANFQIVRAHEKQKRKQKR